MSIPSPLALLLALTLTPDTAGTGGSAFHTPPCLRNPKPDSPSFGSEQQPWGQPEPGVAGETQLWLIVHMCIRTESCSKI